MKSEKTKKLVCSFILFLFVTLGGEIIKGQNHPSVAITFADFNVLRDDFRSLEGRLEYRHSKVNYDAIPFIGLMANTDRAVHVYSGLMYDIQLFDNLFITPSFAPGLYFKGKSKNLDFVLEFRSQIEITIKLRDNTRFGFSFNHISNGRLSLYNPGVESFAVTYIVPL